jgi:hypothetical protein
MANRLNSLFRRRQIRRSRLTAPLAWSGLLAVSRLRAGTFDLYTFDPPPGTRAGAAGWLGFSDSTRTTFAVTGLCMSLANSGDPARDFSGEWAEFIGGHHQPAGERTIVTKRGDDYATKAP